VCVFLFTSGVRAQVCWVFLFFFFCAAAATTATAAEGSLEVLDFDSRHSLVDFPSPRLASKRTGGVSVDDGGQQHDKRIWFEERVRQRQTAKAILPSCSLRQCMRESCAKPLVAGTTAFQNRDGDRCRYHLF
jgi:hypothetical protein